MKEKIFETILDKPVKIERLKRNAEKKIKDGYFYKWGEFKYRWENKNTLLIRNRIWSGEIIFLKTKLKIDLDLPIVHKIPGELVFLGNKKLVYYADMPLLARILAIPIIPIIIKQLTNEIKKLA